MNRPRKKKDFEMNTRKCKCNTKTEKKYLQTHTDYKLVRSFGFDLIQYNFITEKEKKQKHNLIMKLKPIKATSFKKYVKLVINNSDKYGDSKTVLRSWADK